MAYYEISVQEVDNVCQIGWATNSLEQSSENNGQGVGDSEGSWGADGVRKVCVFVVTKCSFSVRLTRHLFFQAKWTDGDKNSFGSPWAKCDVIGFAINLDPRHPSISISVNGSFERPDGVLEDGGALMVAVENGAFPALTCDHGFTCVPNFGEKPFAFTPPSPSYRAVLSFCAGAEV